MLIFTKAAELSAHLIGLKEGGKTLGFVPTMGALHEGHLSLISASQKTCDVTICSVFVNPTQFNDSSDLKNYPRMPEKDSRMLENAFCDILFMPSEQEMYGGQIKQEFDFGYLDKILEGKHRPGHFNGVAQVVKRFFEIIEPHQAFFGSKDYQQVMIVKALVKQMKVPIKIVACPIIREADGLAMSSRNSLLSAEERKIAAIIPEIMQEAKILTLRYGIPKTKAMIERKISAHPSMKLDYFEILCSDTLKPIGEFQPRCSFIVLIAVFVGTRRLIDNLELT